MKENLKKLIRYYKPYRGTFFLDMLFAIMSASVTLVIPLIVRYITSEVAYMDKKSALSTVFIIVVTLVFLVILQAGCNYYISNYGHVMGAKIEYDMRTQIFEHYEKLSFSFYDEQKVGQLLSRITSDLFDITELLHHGPENLVISIIKIMGALCILFAISPKLTLAAFILVPVMLLYAYFLNKKMKCAFKNNRVKIGEVNAQIEDSLSGIRVVKSFANEEIECQKFAKGNDRFLDSKKNSYYYMGKYHSGLTAFTTMINVVVIAVGGVGITRGWVNITDFVTFLLYINVFTEPVKVLVDFTEQFQNGYSGYERFLEIMSLEPEIKEKKEAIELTDVKGKIEFEDVSFKYADGIEYVLENVNLVVEPGKYVALAGPSGVGKTTLCSLIPRFYDVTAGKIKIDDIDIKDVSLKSLRNNIGVVQQDIYLFMGTIKENIRYGKPDATDEEIIEAAKAANAHDFIMSFEKGYDTDIGQRGVKLSGGQKQRISIARVFLKNPPILIFDEATSALDNESEFVVQESLERLAKGRTTVVIAHRLSTIRNAEEIMMLTENGIEEKGTHQQLMEKDGAYAKMVRIVSKMLVVCMIITSCFGFGTKSEVSAGLFARSSVEEIYTEENYTEKTYAENLSELGSADNELAADEFIEEIGELLAENEISDDELEQVLPEKISAEDEQFKTCRLIVKAKKQLSDNTAIDSVSGYRQLNVFQYDSVEETKAAYESFLQDKNVIFVEPDEVVELATDTEEAARCAANQENVVTAGTKFTNQVMAADSFDNWGISFMNIDKYQKTLTEAHADLDEVVVAVVDTGLTESSNSIFNNRIVSGESFTYMDTGYKDPNKYKDDHGHGTAVCGIVAQSTMENVKIMPVKCLDKKGVGSELAVYTGIMYAIENGADIINLSCGTDGQCKLYDDMAAVAKEKNIIVVAASGNESASVSNVSPACIPSVIAVGSINEKKRVSSFSNYGNELDFVAPGEGIRIIDYTGGTLVRNGTSFSTPFISGACALVLSINGSFTPDEVESVLKDNAVDLGKAGWDIYFGNGYIDMTKIAEALSNYIYVANGDVNLDGEVDIIDVLCVLRAIEGEETLTQEQCAKLGEENINNVTMSNAYALMKIIVGT